MPSIQATSRSISSRLGKLENSLKKKLVAFYNANIKGSFEDIAILRQRHDTTIRNIIRKTVQDSYLHGTDVVGTKIAEKSPDFDLFISGTDVNNIQQFTNNMVDQFWATSGRLLARDFEFKQEGGTVVKKPDLNIAAALTGLAAFVAFGAFNNAVKSKLPAATAAAPPMEVQLDIGFTIKELKGRVRFTTQHDSKVDAQICDPLDGAEWDADDPLIVVPPQDTHPHCRCSLIPIVE